MTVDSLVPKSCCMDFPISAADNTNELWPLLLEKAAAKQAGSYAALNGGRVAMALTMLTGDPSCSFQKVNFLPPSLLLLLPVLMAFTSPDSTPTCKDGGSWKQIGAYVPPLATARDIWGGQMISATGWEPSAEEFFGVMVSYKQLGYLIGAGTEGSPGGGLVGRHAYTVLDAQSAQIRGGEHQLVKLRNPHGHGEWTGPWSDGSTEWDDEAKERLNYQPGGDDDVGRVGRALAIGVVTRGPLAAGVLMWALLTSLCIWKVQLLDCGFELSGRKVERLVFLHWRFHH